MARARRLLLNERHTRIRGLSEGSVAEAVLPQEKEKKSKVSSSDEEDKREEKEESS